MKRAIQTCILTGAATLLALSSLWTMAGNDHYRWVDDRGNPVHSDRPPPEGIDYEVISTESSLVRQVTADEGAVPAEVEPTVGNDFEQVDTEEPADTKNNEYCQRARDNLNTLNSEARIRMRNDQGELRYINEEEKEQQRKRAQDMITRHCP